MTSESRSTLNALRQSPSASFALIALLLLATFLHFFRLDQQGLANLYYAATVKSLLTSWHNFFYAAFDPGGFVSVDKPPLGFWVQALSATIFGFNGFALLLPQAFAGVLSVALLYRLVARVFGVWAGIIAALALTVTPISIAANRNNTIDSQLVFTSLLAAWAVSIAIERGKLRWLVVCAILVGIGFNIKMLQAYLVLPAFWLTYLIAARTRWYWRLVHLALATIVLVIVSFAWIAIFDATPAEARPYAGSSRNNSMLELVIGHNGITRLGAIANALGLRAAAPQPRAAPLPPQNPPRPPNAPPNPPPISPPTPPQPNAPRPPINETGEPGILRLFNRQLAGQISWLLPLALFSILVLTIESLFTLYVSHLTPHVSRLTYHALLLWSIWLVPQIIFFSFAGLFHRHYLEMMSPAIAALVGAGIVTMWRAYAPHRWRGLVLPFVLLMTALAQVALLTHFPDWSTWLTPIILGLTLLTTLALVALKFAPMLGSLRAPTSPRHSERSEESPDSRKARFFVAQIAPQNDNVSRYNMQRVIATLGVLTSLIAPTAWSLTPLANADAALPFAGPELLTRAPRPPTPQRDRMVNFLLANRQGERFLVATPNATTAAPIILATGEPVMALGGFGGGDRIVTVNQLAAHVASGTVRFFLLTEDWRQQPELSQWIRTRCTPILSAPRVPNPAPSGQQLYDCKPK